MAASHQLRSIDLPKGCVYGAYFPTCKPHSCYKTVYDHIPITTRHHTYPAADIWRIKLNIYWARRSASITLVTKSILASLLATCKLIQLDLKLEVLAKEPPLRFVIDADAWNEISCYPCSLIIACVISNGDRSDESCKTLQRHVIESLSYCLPKGSVVVGSRQFENPHFLVSKCALWNSKALTTSRNIARRAEVEICVPDAFHLAAYLMESPALYANHEVLYDTKLMCGITKPVPSSIYGEKGVLSITSEWPASDINVVKNDFSKGPSDEEWGRVLEEDSTL